MNRPHENGKGFTLAESLLAAVILTVAITAITMPFAVGARCEETDARMTLAVNLAQEMMEEVLAKPLVDPSGSDVFGPDSGETSRTRYDDMNDYMSCIEAPRQIKDAGGTVITTPLAAMLSRETCVENFWLDGQDHGQPADFYRVTVIVKNNGAEMVRLTRLVCKKFEFN